MISPWSLFQESITLFLTNFKYLLKFWSVSVGLWFLSLLPLILAFLFLGFKFYKNLEPPTNPQFTVILLMTFSIIFFIVLSLWLTSASLIQTKSIIENQKLAIKQILGQGWKIVGKILVTGLLTGLAVAGGFLLLIIPGFIFSYWFAFTSQIVVIENLSGTAALKRSKQLVKGRFWKTVSYLLFPTAIIIAYSFITSAVAAAIPKPSRSVFELLFSIVTWPFGLVSLIYSFLVYREFKKINISPS